MLEKLAAATPKGHGTTKTTNEKSVNKMTDTSKYTGAHKERFDASGKGKGLEGRADIVENKEIGRAHVWNSSHITISYAVFCLKKKNKKY